MHFASVFHMFTLEIHLEISYEYDRRTIRFLGKFQLTELERFIVQVLINFCLG